MCKFKLYPRASCFLCCQVSTLDHPLNGDAVIRGAYVNAGSKDIGPDPSAEKYKKQES